MSSEEWMLTLFYWGLLLLVIFVIYSIFRKLGRYGWEGLIPIYNLVILYHVVWGSGWYVILQFIPFVGTVIGFVTLWKLYRGFSKGLLFTLMGLICPPIALVILAFDSSRWQNAF